MPFQQVATERNQPVELYYEDFGEGRPVILIHGWPVTHAMWETQVEALVSQGNRVITYDRRGFGDSTKTSGGHDYVTFASDLNELINALGLTEVTLSVSRWVAARLPAISALMAPQKLAKRQCSAR